MKIHAGCVFGHIERKDGAGSQALDPYQKAIHMLRILH
jgi:hypothetical protein